MMLAQEMQKVMDQWFPFTNGIFGPDAAFSAGFRPQRSAATPAAKSLVRPYLGSKSTISEWTPCIAQQGYLGSGSPHSWMGTKWS